MNIGIIADDLTSAADASLPFFNEGASCEVLRNHYKKSNAELIAVDSNSRNLSESDACYVVGKLTAQLSSKDILLKTVDSTLRGHIKSEIKASFLISKRDLIVIAPAFPAAGRTTIKGLQYVDGVLVSNSKYKHDPTHPCKSSQVSDLVDASLGNYIILSSDASAEEVNRAIQDFNVIILDAKTQQSLDRLVSYIPNPKKILWVGSPGLSYALSQVYAFSNQRKPRCFDCKKILVVIGSANEISKQQKKALAYPNIAIDEEISNTMPFPDIAVIAAPEHSVGSSQLLLEQISLQASQVLKAGRYDALIATGGETVNAILEHLGVEQFAIIDEFEAGFPIGISADISTLPPLIIGLKAGGFGTPTSLKDAVEKLTKFNV